ncbi:MAG: zinc-binding dehydrogenase [Deltaproteobacteria bacterium]|nr:zinc-binding dehydrogenase [Deltaproteobacteria bacterium]
MKAVFIPETGGPEVLTYGDVAEPAIGAGDLLVQVKAAALNRRDLFARAGTHGVKPTLPHVPGLEVAGEVVRAGPEATTFKIGDRVLGRCRGGGYAELARMEAADAYPFPEWMSFEEAACIAVPFGTAWRMLVRRAMLKSGEDLLVIAAGSGIGSGAIQLGKLLGARVITTASAQWKLDKAAELGADAGINYKEFPEFSKKVQELTGGEGVHVIFEHVGAAVWGECFASLRRGGRFINSGVTAGHRVELHLGQLWTRELTLMGTTMRPRDDMPAVMTLVRGGKLRGVVSEVLPLREAARAHDLMERSEFFGKIVLVP